MITNYKFKVSYRMRRENQFKLTYVKTLDKEGNEVVRKVDGKPYTEKMPRSLYFNDESKAQRVIDRLKRKDAKVVKLFEGNFQVEEMSI